MNDRPLLEIHNFHLGIQTSPHRHVPILCGIDLAIRPGEALGLVGESGCGKSMTAQAILRLFNHPGLTIQGQILFEGQPLHLKTEREMKKIRGKKIGMVFQDPMTSLNPTLTIGWQIAEMLVVHEHLSRKAAKLRAIELLKQVGIADPRQRYDAYPFQLSGGMRQRILIAMALACHPRLLIADEPTTALDVTVQTQILELLRTLQQESGMSLLLITHDLSTVASLCDRVAVMNRGKIVETGEVSQLFYTPQHPYTCTLLAAKREPLYAS
jgi:ABC-type dipeptide/oligopeptide/nickel transport system ATPase component